MSLPKSVLSALSRAPAAAVAHVLFDAELPNPSAAASTLITAVVGAGAYASRIIAQGRDYTDAVCAAVNEQLPDATARRPIYRVLAQAARDGVAPFSITSTKRGGIATSDEAAKPSESRSASKSASSASSAVPTVAAALETLERALNDAFAPELDAQQRALALSVALVDRPALVAAFRDAFAIADANATPVEVTLKRTSKRKSA